MSLVAPEKITVIVYWLILGLVFFSVPLEFWTTGQTLLSELAAKHKRVLVVNGVVSMSCLMDELSIKPLQVRWF
jgi:hypothetical protein